MQLEASLAAAAAALRRADAMVVATGAGMGVDSGLPDFRGDQGFWKAYPMYERLGLSFVDAANPEHFDEDPAFGWGFYGHRLRLYRETVPHEGYGILQRWASALGIPWFAVTSNVDGHFQASGVDPDRVLEVHGSIHHLQCTAPCSEAIWENREEVEVDLDTMRARNLPRCPRCLRVARPNILMFGDHAWLRGRTAEQEARFEEFRRAQDGGRMVVLELGAGTAVATIRWITERLGSVPGAVVARINPREADIRPPHLSVPAGALSAIRAIDAALSRG